MLHINTIIFRDSLHLLIQIIVHALPYAHPLLGFTEVEIHITGEQYKLEYQMTAIVAPAF